jgi:hypothetical protein
MVTHRINRVEFELEVSAVELGRHVSDRVSMLSGQRISSLLDRVCSEVDDAEPIQRIDALELELGSIALENFDDELLAKLEVALRLALRGRTQAQLPSPSDDEPPEPSSESETPKQFGRGEHALELLDAYAWTGNLPWWADAREHELLTRHVRELLLHAPTRWLELLHAHADDRVGLDRLARACDAELFATVLERAGAGSMLADLHELEQLLARVGVRSERMRAPLLASLGRRGRIDPATVLPTVLRELDTAVLAALAERLDARPQVFTALRAAIASVRVQAQERENEVAEALESFHEHDADAATNARAEPESRSESGSGSKPETASEVESESERAGDPVEPAASQSPATIRDPEHARPAEPVPARNDRDARELQLARRRALARLDELYIEDAGLVILWPFIERLFTRVELLDERRFRDEAAQTTGIALLAHLALGDPAVPEHQLTLAKLLCGRALEHPCELDAPLDPALCEESEHMLAAVIDHAPILDAMPIPRFRATFLQRSAALSVRSGSWLLTVERQPYDLILQRFSWSWAWVKFPWMPDPLTVEW